MALYMSYGSIKGNVTTSGYEDWIELQSFQYGIGRGVGSAKGSDADREASEVSASEVVVTKMLDKSSTDLLKEAYSSDGSNKVVIKFTRTDKGGALTYLTYELTDVILSGYSISSGGDKPSESLSLNFVQVTTTFAAMGADGKAANPGSVIYNLSTGKTG